MNFIPVSLIQQPRTGAAILTESLPFSFFIITPRTLRHLFISFLITEMWAKKVQYLLRTTFLQTIHRSRDIYRRIQQPIPPYLLSDMSLHNSHADYRPQSLLFCFVYVITASVGEWMQITDPSSRQRGRPTWRKEKSNCQTKKIKIFGARHQDERNITWTLFVIS
jgi:hypothetical protein